VVRITHINGGERPRVVKVEGRLSGPWVDALSKVLDDAGRGASLVLDLGGLTAADPDGLALLRDVQATGAELKGLSLFLTNLLMDGHDERA